MPEAAGPWARGAKEAEDWVGGTLGAKGRTVVGQVKEAGASSILWRISLIFGCGIVPEMAGEGRPAEAGAPLLSPLACGSSRPQCAPN